MSGHFQKHGLKANDAEVATLTRALGHAPRAFEAFAHGTATAWVQEAAAARERPRPARAGEPAFRPAPPGTRPPLRTGADGPMDLMPARPFGRRAAGRA